MFGSMAGFRFGSWPGHWFGRWPGSGKRSPAPGSVQICHSSGNAPHASSSPRQRKAPGAGPGAAGWRFCALEALRSSGTRLYRQHRAEPADGQRWTLDVPWRVRHLPGMVTRVTTVPGVKRTPPGPARDHVSDHAVLTGGSLIMARKSSKCSAPQRGQIVCTRPNTCQYRSRTLMLIRPPSS